MTRRIGLVVAGLVATATMSSGMAQTAADTSDGTTSSPDVGTTARVPFTFPDNDVFVID